MKRRDFILNAATNMVQAIPTLPMSGSVMRPTLDSERNAIALGFDSVSEVVSDQTVKAGDFCITPEGIFQVSLGSGVASNGSTVYDFSTGSNKAILFAGAPIENPFTLLADTRPPSIFSEGQVLGTRDGYFYEVQPADSPMVHLTTTGGTKLRVMPIDGPNGNIFALRAFGAREDGLTDDSAAMIKSCAAIQANGGGVLRLNGVARITEKISITGWTRNFALHGGDPELHGIHITESDTRIFHGIAAAEIDFRLEKINLRGPWASDPKESGSEAWLVDIFGLRRFVTHNCRFSSSQKGLVKVRASELAESINCHYEEAIRDAWNITGSSNSKFIGNTVRHVRDDAVALHVQATADATVGRHIVANNHFQDCQGIAAMGARNLVVTNNVGVMMRTRFCVVGYDSTFNEGNITPYNITIQANLVENLFDFDFYEGQGTNHYFTYVYPIHPSDGGTLPAPPGMNDTGSGGIVPLYGNLNRNGPNEAFGFGFGVTISDNKFIRTIASGVDYESYNYGKFITPSGYASGTPRESDLRSRCRFGEGIRDFRFQGNFVQGASVGLDFDFVSGDFGFLNGLVKDNTFRDCPANLISTNASQNNANILQVRFEDNTLDGDPFYSHTDRNHDGSWSSEGGLYAFFLPYCNGWVGSGNHVLNVSCVEYPNESIRSWTDRNYQYGQLINSSFSIGNKGIGRPCSALQNWILVDMECDTRSTEFGAISHNIQSASSMPSDGYWLEGMFMQNRGSSAVCPNESGVILSGWLRRTTGNTHVLGVDWMEILVQTQTSSAPDISDPCSGL